MYVTPSVIHLFYVAEKEAVRSLPTLPHQQTGIEPTPSEAGDREDYQTAPTLLAVRNTTSPASGGDILAPLRSYKSTTSKSTSDSGNFPSPFPPSVRHDVESLADSTLESIRLGNIVAGKDQGGTEHCEPNETYRKHRGTCNMEEYLLVTTWYALCSWHYILVCISGVVIIVVDTRVFYPTAQVSQVTRNKFQKWLVSFFYNLNRWHLFLASFSVLLTHRPIFDR